MGHQTHLGAGGDGWKTYRPGVGEGSEQNNFTSSEQEEVKKLFFTTLLLSLGREVGTKTPF